MIIPFRGAVASLSGSTCSPSTHASTRAGDLLVLAVHSHWGSALGAGVITPPAGWTLIARSVIGSSGTYEENDVAHYYRNAAASGAVAHVVSFDSAFTGSPTQALITTYAGSSGLDGTPHVFGGTTNSFTPAAPSPSGYARGIIAATSNGAPAIGTANGWARVAQLSGTGSVLGAVFELTDEPAPMVSPILSAGNRWAAISYALASDGPVELVHAGELR